MSPDGGPDRPMTERHDAGTSGPNDSPHPSPIILLVEDDDAVRGLLPVSYTHLTLPTNREV